MDTTIFVDLVRYGHLLAVAMGLGAAAMADYTALTRLGDKITPEVTAILQACHRLIWPAVIAMWLTGFALIGIRTGFEISAFSPKLFAKLFVVTLLTLNAVAIGRIAMPLMAKPGGLSSLTRSELRLCAIMGGISSASWLLALAMGSSRFLAAAPALLFLILLPLAFVCAVLGARLVLGLLTGERSVTIVPRQRLEFPTVQVAADAASGPQVRSYKIGLFPRRRAVRV